MPKDPTTAAPETSPLPPADRQAAADLFGQLGRSLDDREAILRAREQAVAERSSLLAERARELAHVEALVSAREGVVREREARLESVGERLRADATRLELQFGEFSGARAVLDRAAQLDQVELDVLAKELALEVRELLWWGKVTGRTDLAELADERTAADRARANPG